MCISLRSIWERMMIFNMRIACRLRLVDYAGCYSMCACVRQNAPMYMLFDVHIAHWTASCSCTDLYNVRIARCIRQHRTLFNLRMSKCAYLQTIRRAHRMPVLHGLIQRAHVEELVNRRNLTCARARLLRPLVVQCAHRNASVYIYSTCAWICRRYNLACASHIRLSITLLWMCIVVCGYPPTCSPLPIA